MKQRITLVIPAYNEERHLRRCLNAVGKQSVMPDEVLVVDNNSTDRTVAIAQEFPFVTVLNEPNQGVLYARDAGFNAAKGEIIGRIDVDTILPSDWVETVQQLFQDKTIDAVTGSLHYYDVAWSQLIDSVDLYCREWLSRHMNEHLYLLGSNMAIRKSAWDAVRSRLCYRKNMHEDLDLAVHMGDMKQKVVLATELVANVSGRRIDASFIEFCHYAYMSPYTYARHHLAEHRFMYPIAALVFVCYIPLRLLYRGFDETTQRFAWHQVLTKQLPKRVNPTRFVLDSTDIS